MFKRANIRRISPAATLLCGLWCGAEAGAQYGQNTPAANPVYPSYQVKADGIAQPLAPPGDALRGRALLIARDPANCILCHGLSDPAVRFAGNLAPPLDGAGSRLSIAQLRLRVADSSRINPETIMPAYYRTEGLRAVAAAYQGRPVLTAQQVEDVVVYLSTLR